MVVYKDIDKSRREKIRRTRETNMRTRIVVDKYTRLVERTRWLVVMAKIIIYQEIEALSWQKNVVERSGGQEKER